MTISLRFHGEAQFANLDLARLTAQAIELLLTAANVKTGNVALNMLPNEGGMAVEVYPRPVDTSAHVRGVQAATDLANRYIATIEKGLADVTPQPGHWQALLDTARTTGEVDLNLLADLMSDREGCDATTLPRIVGEVAQAQAARQLGNRK